MTFPTVQSLTGTAFGTNATAHLVAMPATVNSGDLLVIIFASDGGPTITNPSGWTQQVNAAGENSHSRIVTAKIAAGTEGGTTVDVVTSAAEQGAAQVYRITGWFGTLATGLEVGTSNGVGGVDTNSPPALDPSQWGVEDTLWIACLTAGTASSNNNVSTYPTGYTNGTETDPSGGGNGALVASCRLQSAVASEDAGDFVLDAAPQGSRAFTIAVRPAAGGNTGTIAATQAADVGALSGTIANPITGTIAASQDAQTGALVGAESFLGTVTATQDDQTGSFTGTVANPVTGVLGATQEDQIADSIGTGPWLGTVGYPGTIGAVQDPNTAAFSGTVANPVTGTIGATQEDDTAAFAGDAVSDGTLNAIQQDQVGAFVGLVANPVTGTIGVTQQDQTGTFTGTNTPPGVTGTIDATQDDQEGAFTGTQTIPAVTGVLGAVQEPDIGLFLGEGVIPIVPPPGTVTCTIGGPSVECVLTAPSVACTITQVSVAGTDTVVTSEFRNAAGTLTDPATVTATVQHPDGTQTSPTPSSASVGIWTTVIPSDLDEGGWWFGQIQGTGNGVNAVCKFSFCLESSLVLV